MYKSIVKIESTKLDQIENKWWCRKRRLQCKEAVIWFGLCGIDLDWMFSIRGMIQNGIDLVCVVLIWYWMFSTTWHDTKWYWFGLCGIDLVLDVSTQWHDLVLDVSTACLTFFSFFSFFLKENVEANIFDSFYCFKQLSNSI